MGKLGLRPYDIRPYFSGAHLLRNPETGKSALLTDYQAALLERCEQQEDIAAILFPHYGLASARHFDQVVQWIELMRELDLFEGAAVATTLPKAQKEKVNSSAQLLTAFAGKFFSGFPLLLFPALSLFGALALIFCKIPNPGDFSSLSEVTVGVAVFLAGLIGSWNWKEIYRAGMFSALRVPIEGSHWHIVSALPQLRFSTKRLYLAGLKNRRMVAACCGFSPIVLAGIISVLGYFSLIPPLFTAAFLFGSFLAMLLAFCPFLEGDGLELLELAIRPEKLDSDPPLVKLKSFWTGISPAMESGRERAFFGLALAVWLVLWIDISVSGVEFVLSRALGQLPQRSGLQEQIFLFLPTVILAVVSLTPIICLVSLIARILHTKSGPAENAINEVDLAHKREILGRIPLFTALNEADREALIDELENHFFEPGQYLVKQGDPGRELFVLLAGTAQAVFRDANRKIHEVGQLQAGDAFGEIALIDDVPRTASIVAITKCQVVALAKEDFARLILSRVPDVDRIKQMIRLSSFFRRHPLLSRLDAKSQAEIINRFRYRSFVSNETLVSPEQTDARFGIVYTGRAIATQRDLSQPLPLATEDAFGYLFSGRSGGFLPEVKAREGGGVLTLSQEEFQKYLLEPAVRWAQEG